MRDPEQDEDPQRPGGRAAERLREFLAARFGPDAPTIPPDETVDDDDEAGDSPGTTPTD